VFPAPGRTESELLRLAASAERYSEHPLGKAIVEAAAERGIALEEATGFTALAGHGVRARVAGTTSPSADREPASRSTARPAGAIEIADTIKPEAAQAVRRLRDRGSGSLDDHRR